MSSRQPLFFCALLLFAFQQQCNVTTPASIKETAEKNVRNYFPNAFVSVSSKGTGTISVVTCTQGLGPDALEAIKDHLKQDQVSSGNITANIGVAESALKNADAHYRYLVLYFDNGRIQYDRDAHWLSVVHDITPELLNTYETKCGFAK